MNFQLFGQSFLYFVFSLDQYWLNACVGVLRDLFGFGSNANKSQQKKKIRNSLTGHTDTTIWATLIQAGTFVLAGIGITFIDVDFASCTSETNSTIATIRTGCIHTATTMFAWWTTIMAFVDIFHTIGTLVAGWTATNISTIHRASIAYCASCKYKNRKIKWI